MYVPVNEVGFDVLRDRLVTDLDDVVVPEPDVAVVDEADSVLVDSARVPLVLAGDVDAGVVDAEIVATVRRLRADVHYETDPAGRTVHLTALGLARVERRLGGIDLYTEDQAHTLAAVNVALYAHALLHRDVDYLVRDGKVELIDDSRGRVAHLQRWPDGLQAAVEAMEGLEASPTGAVLDRIVVQTLVGRYRTLCGMTGTAVAVAEELHEFYKLTVGAVDTNEPCIREDLPDRIYRSVEEKERAIVAHVAEIHATGQPVLLGTQDVAESERLAGALRAAEVECAVLNARNDAEEAAIVARAGERDRVTISTQMAGRGTDIRLGEGVVELGGLHVVCSGRHITGRLDDQLRGRAGRQGDPGSALIIASVEDDVVARERARRARFQRRSGGRPHPGSRRRGAAGPRPAHSRGRRARDPPHHVALRPQPRHPARRRAAPPHARPAAPTGRSGSCGRSRRSGARRSRRRSARRGSRGRCA